MVGDIRPLFGELARLLRRLECTVASQSRPSGVYDVTTSDTADLPHGSAIGVRAGVAGNIKATFADGSVNTIKVAADTNEFFAIQRIWATGTTATGIKALY